MSEPTEKPAKKPKLEPQDHGGALLRGRSKIANELPALSAETLAQPGEFNALTPKHLQRIPQPHGGALAAGGTPGHKGGSGRPSNAFLERCAKASEDPALWAAAAKKHPLGLLDLSAGYAHGKPKDTTELTGEVTIKVKYDDE